MNKTKIDWCDATWNPVTGCLHGCEYCYAQRFAERFTRRGDDHCHDCTQPEDIRLHEQRYKHGTAEYRYGFAPTFHPYRLREPQTVRRAKTVFVCSMADLFGEWVPDEWIEAVFEACEAAPWHKYLFLSKNPHAYCDHDVPNVSNYWYGQSDDGRGMLTGYDEDGINTFLSVEPILKEPRIEAFEWFKWIIVGAETGNRKDKITPERGWIESIVRACEDRDIPLFMKSSLADIWGEPLIQQWPEGLGPR